MATDDFERKIADLKSSIKSYETKKAQLSGQLEVRQKELDVLEAKLKKAKLTIESLPKAITKIESMLNEKLEKATKELAEIEEGIKG